MTSGRCSCTGFGSRRASFSWKCLPSNVVVSSVHRLRMMRQASSSMSMRTPIRGNGMPYWSCSSSNQAAPIPSSSRPPETWSMVAAMFATTAGCRYVTPRTSIPQRTRLVCAAIADSSVRPSN